MRHTLSNERFGLLKMTRMVALYVMTVLSLLLIHQEGWASEAVQVASGDGEIYHSLAGKKSTGVMNNITERLTFGGLLEVEASLADDSSAGKTSDVTLATVEVGIDGEFNDNIAGHILLLWEEDATDPLALDEGALTITLKEGFSLVAGKMYLPFGVFNSHFVSDPQTLELGEINESALLLTYERGAYELSAAIFNGSVDRAGEDEIVDYILSITASPAEWLTLGASYLSDLSDTDGDFTSLGASGTKISHIVAAYHLSGSYHRDAISVEAEVVGAVESFDTADVPTGDKPFTYNIEFAYEVEESWAAAVKFEGNDGFTSFPERQYGIATSYGLFEHTTIAVEYLHGEFNSGADRDMVTAQLAFEF